MALFGIGTMAVCLLLAATDGQFSPGPEEPCNEKNTAAGKYHMSDHVHCQKFVTCDQSGRRFIRSCAGIELFDYIHETCKSPGDAICLHWPCDQSNNGTLYPATCSRGNYMCLNGTYVYLECPINHYFRMSDGTCVEGVGNDDSLCNQQSSPPEPEHCTDSPDKSGNPCAYTTSTGVTRPCPVLLAFNETDCKCTIYNANCTFKSQTKSKNPDPECRPSNEINFTEYDSTTGAPKVFCPKDEAYTYYYIANDGATYSAGLATLSNDAAVGKTSYLQAYFLNNNEMTQASGYSVVFQTNEPTSKPVELVTNDFMGTCNRTVHIVVTREGNTYKATAEVEAMKKVSMKQTVTARDTISGSLETETPSDFIRVTVMVIKGILNLKMTNCGQNGTTIGISTTVSGTKQIGTTINTNKCVVRLCQHLDGNIKQIQIIEGCLHKTPLDKY